MPHSNESTAELTTETPEPSKFGWHVVREVRGDPETPRKEIAAKMREVAPSMIFKERGWRE